MKREYETTIVGLSGPTCSGKTTLAQEILRTRPQDVKLLPFDEYWINVIPTLKNDELPDWESPESYDVARFLNDLQALKGDQTFILERVVTPSKLLIVDGFLIYYSAVSRACFDKKIYIDLPEEEIIKRRLARPRRTFGIDDEREYLDKMLLPGLQKWVYPQRQYADIVLDGLKPVNVLAQEVLGFLGV